VDDYYKIKTTEEIKSQFEEWLASGGPAAAVNGAAGGETSRGPAAGSSDLDKLAQGASDAAAPAEKPAKKSGKKSIDEELEDIVGGLDDEG
jgi:hypothetical protein